MTDDAAPSTPTASDVLPTGPAPVDPHGPSTPAPGDPQAAARRAIAAAVDRLEESRSRTLDDQLAAAEAVHEALSAHLSGNTAASR